MPSGKRRRHIPGVSGHFLRFLKIPIHHHYFTFFKSAEKSLLISCITKQTAFMKNLFLIGFTLFTANIAFAQTWKKEQIMPAAELAAKINAPSGDKPMIFNVGPMDNIKTSRYVGKGTSVTAIDKMKQELS